jgi:mercuric ion transport protein
MQTSTTTDNKSVWLSYVSLFTSVSTLLCCALPSMLVLAGLGATVASMLSALPWLVKLSQHKQWTFGISGALISLSFVNMYWLAPRLQRGQCPADDPNACAKVSRVSKVLLWISAVTYGLGFFVAYALGPILTKLDNG